MVEKLPKRIKRLYEEKLIAYGKFRESMITQLVVAEVDVSFFRRKVITGKSIVGTDKKSMESELVQSEAKVKNIEEILEIVDNNMKELT